MRTDPIPDALVSTRSPFPLYLALGLTLLTPLPGPAADWSPGEDPRIAPSDPWEASWQVHPPDTSQGEGGSLEAMAAPGERLSLDEAIRRARSQNPGRQRAGNELVRHEWDVRSARGDLLPSLSTGFGVTWEGTGSRQIGSVTEEELGVGGRSSTLFSSVEMGVEWRMSRAALMAPRERQVEMEAAQEGLREGDLTLERDVTHRYLDALREAENLRLAQEELSRAEDNLTLAEAQVEVGTASRLDAQQAQIAVGRARVDRVRAEAEERNARIRLLEILGEDPVDRPLELTTRIDPEPLDGTESELLAQALEASPAIRQVQARERRADLGVRSARSSFLPSLSVWAGWSGFTRSVRDENQFVDGVRQQMDGQLARCEMDNEIFRRLADPLPTQDCSALEWTDAHRTQLLAQHQRFPFDFTRQPPQLSLSVSLPVFQGMDRRRALESARVERENTRLELEEEQLALRARIGEGLSRAGAAWEAMELEDQNRELARDQLRLAREQFELGMVEFIQLSEAETGLARAERDYLSAVYEYRQVIADLQVLIGVSLLNH